MPLPGLFRVPATDPCPPASAHQPPPADLRQRLVGQIVSGVAAAHELLVDGGRYDGGRYWVRTSGLLGVNEALSR